MAYDSSLGWALNPVAYSGGADFMNQFYRNRQYDPATYANTDLGSTYYRPLSITPQNSQQKFIYDAARTALENSGEWTMNGPNQSALLNDFSGATESPLKGWAQQFNTAQNTPAQWVSPDSPQTVSAPPDPNAGLPNWNMASDDELSKLYQAAADPSWANSQWGDHAQRYADLNNQYASLMAQRAEDTKRANDTYQNITLGGNYAGGILPKEGYNGTLPAGQQNQFTNKGAFSTGPESNTQPTGYGYPSPGFSGWGGPQNVGGLGGLGGWGGPFGNKNPFAPT